MLKIEGASWSGFSVCQEQSTKKDTFIQSGVCAGSVRLEQAVTSLGRLWKGHRARVWVVSSPISSGESLTQISNTSTISTSKDTQRPLVDEEKLSFFA